MRSSSCRQLRSWFRHRTQHRPVLRHHRLELALSVRSHQHHPQARVPLLRPALRSAPRPLRPPLSVLRLRPFRQRPRPLRTVHQLLSVPPLQLLRPSARLRLGPPLPVQLPLQLPPLAHPQLPLRHLRLHPALAVAMCRHQPRWRCLDVCQQQMSRSYAPPNDHSCSTSIQTPRLRHLHRPASPPLLASCDRWYSTTAS